MNKNHEPHRKALGKGLSALLPARPTPRPPGPAPDTETKAETTPRHIPIADIDPNPLQPRSIFEPESLSQLAQSIVANGIIQPLIVQRHGDRYQLVAGERRWRAAKIAGLSEVPVVIQEFASDRLLEIALVENIQREDLNPIEVAQALDRLSRDYNLTHEQVAQRTGKDRTTVTNLIRLLKLPQDIQLLLAERRLSMGHARALLALPTEDRQKELAERAAAQGWSVRQIERFVQAATADREPAEPSPANQRRTDPNVQAAVAELESTLGTRVRIVSQSDNRGRIEIEYYSFEDLDRIYNQIVGNKSEM